MDRAARNTEVLERRVPWVSFSLVCLSVVGFAYAKIQAIEIEAVVEPQLSVAEVHFRAHPYLAMPSLLEARIDASTARQLRREYEVRQERQGSVPRPPRLVAREQMELDRMARQIVLKLESRPEYQLGMVAIERNPVTYFSHLFLHGGFAHLAICMFLLVALGRSLESAWGTALTLCGVSAAVLGSVGVFLTQQPEQAQPLIGTSGLLSGFVGAFAVRFLGSQRSVAYWPLLILALIGLWLPPWLGSEWSIARGIGAPPPLVGGWNPSMWALVGGLGTGVGFAVVVRLLGLERLIEREEVATELRRGGHDAEVERALQDRSAGKPEQAFRRLHELLRREPDNGDASLAFWDVCNSLDRPQAAAPYLLRVVREAVRQGDSERALHGWLELTCTDLDTDTDAEPALLLRMVVLLRDAGHAAAAVRALRQALQRADASGGASVASRVARASLDLDPDTAAEAAWQALGSLDIDLEERQALEELLAPLVSRSGRAAEGQVPCDPVARMQPVGDTVSNLDAATEPDGIEMLGFGRELELVTAVPLKLDETGLLIAVGQARKRVCYDRIDAVAVAAVEGLAAKPVIVIDLVLNWESTADEPLKVIRLRTDAFDPRSLIMRESDPAVAVRALSVRLQHETRATPLPDETSTHGEPFAAFKTLEEYQRDVLQIDAEG